MELPSRKIRPHQQLPQITQIKGFDELRINQPYIVKKNEDIRFYVGNDSHLYNPKTLVFKEMQSRPGAKVFIFTGKDSTDIHTFNDFDLIGEDDQINIWKLDLPHTAAGVIAGFLNGGRKTKKTKGKSHRKNKKQRKTAKR